MTPGRQDLYLNVLRVLTYSGLVIVAVAPLSSVYGTTAAVCGAAAAILAARLLAASHWRWWCTFAGGLAIAVLGLASDRVAGGFAGPARLLGPAGALELIDVLTFGLMAFGLVLALRTLTSKFPSFAFVEAACIVVAVAYSFRGHRRYPFSQPQVLSDWAFSQGYDPRHVIMYIGVTTLAALGLILLPRQYLARTVVAVAFILLFPMIGPQILSHTRWNPLAETKSQKEEEDEELKQVRREKRRVIPVPVKPLPKLTIEDARTEEGNAGTRTLTFSVSLSEASQSPVSVNYSTTGGTATPEDDYTPAVGTLLIPPGQVRSTVNVAILGDTDFEPDETLLVKLTHPVHAQFARDEAVGMIVNDDPAKPELSIRGIKFPEGNAGLTAASFEVVMSAASPNPVIVRYKTVGLDLRLLSAVNGVSRIPTEGKNLVVVAIVDRVLHFRIFDGDGKIVVDTDEKGLRERVRPIEDLRNQLKSLWPPHKLTGSEKGRVISAVTSIVGHTQTVAGTATAGEDFEEADGTVRIPPGQTRASITVNVIGDTTVEPDEMFAVELSNPVAATLRVPRGTGTIENDDKGEEPPPHPKEPPSLSIDDWQGDEGNSGNTAATFHVTLSEPTDQEVTVECRVIGRTATRGSDYLQPPVTTLRIPKGTKVATFPVTVVGDTTVEPDETFVAELANPKGATVERPLGTGTIKNDDHEPVPPGLSIDDVAVNEGSAGKTAAMFTIKLSEPSPRHVEVTYRTVAGTAEAGKDFVPLEGTLKIPAGVTQAGVTVEVLGDEDVEEDETFTLELSKPVNATLARGTGTGTIRNDDKGPPLPRVSIESAKLPEGNKGTTPLKFLVKLSAPSTKDVSVQYKTDDGTAVSGEDFRPAEGTLNFPPGTTAQTITVDVHGDTVYESDEMFLVRLSEPSAANLGNDKAMGGIINDDEPPKEKLPDDEFDWTVSHPKPLKPALLLRIRDDYDPVEKGYYLRTQAYSQLVGTRLLRSEMRDADVGWSLPTQRLDLPAFPPRKTLRDIVAAVFLIGDHESAPLLVQGVLIDPQENPSPDDFSAAYLVTSQVLAQGGANHPASAYAELARMKAGNPSWDEATRKSYLEYPPNQKYRDLAMQIANTLTASQRESPLARALAIRKWMEANFIYDYNPRHSKAEDRTASFLFGDCRGYCIHFAHAMTFLLRAQGIPARLAVGYRVGLERAGRRGAFVAYNNDLHAWAEMYLDQVGWVVVEAGAKGRIPGPDPESDPRELDRFLNLLSEVPPEVLADEEARPPVWRRAAVFGPPLVLLAAVLSLYAVKLWRALCPRFARESALPRVGYRAVLDRLAEIGYRRRYGETWEEFAVRLHAVSPELARLTEMHLRHVFRRDAATQVHRWWELYAAVMGQVTDKVPPGRRWLGWLNPVSWIGVG